MKYDAALKRGHDLISRSICDVRTDGICTGCGTCAGICPASAITLALAPSTGTYLPVVDSRVCSGCELCRKVCPPLTWSNQPDTGPWHASVGNFFKVFSAFSADKSVRFDSASGGFITTLLVHLLSRGYITGAVVTRRLKENPLLSEPFLATSAEEIVSAQGSKYSPVTFDKILKNLVSLDPCHHRIAVVGLPCHVEGVHRAALQHPILKNLIRYKIGIVCGQSPSILAYDYLLRRLKVDRNDLLTLSNRGGGWPGFMTITEKNGQRHEMPYGSHLSMGTVLSSPLFTPAGCQLCADPGGFSSDVIVSDAWLNRFQGDTHGVNLAVVKSLELERILDSMQRDGEMVLGESNLDEFINANRNVMTHKIFNRKIGFPFLLGPKSLLYCTQMVSADVGLARKLRLSLFYLHIKLLRKIQSAGITILVNQPLLYYFKILNILKR